MPNLKRTALFAVIAVALLVPAILVATIFNVAGVTRGVSFAVELWAMMNLALFLLFWSHRETTTSARLVIWLVAVSLGVVSMFAARRIGIALFFGDITDFKYATYIDNVSWLLAVVITSFVAIRLNQRLTKSVAQEH